MRKLLLALGLSIALAFGLNAQTKPKPKGIFLHHTHVMDELSMTPEQRAKIMEIKNVTDPKIRAIRQNTSLSDDERKQELKQVYAERKKMQEDALTAEQNKKLKQMRIEERKNRKK